MQTILAYFVFEKVKTEFWTSLGLRMVSLSYSATIPDL